MKRIFFIFAMSLFWSLSVMTLEIKAQYVYYYTDVQYVPAYRYVDGYTTTWLDYDAGLYYDPAVKGELYRSDMNETPLDEDYNVGFADLVPAEVYLFSSNYVEGKTYCTSGTHFVIDAYTGQRYTVARLYPCITIPIPPPPTPTPTPMPTPTPTPTVTSVTFEQIQPSIEPISQNPVVAPYNPGIGQRIFPDDDFPNDPVDRRRIRVTATLSQPIPNVSVYFRNFDLDDPATDTIIDPNGTAGNDNHGTPMAGMLSACSATSNGCTATSSPSGVATVEFTVTRQPGDNFAIAAGVIPAEVGAVTMNGSDLINSGGQTIPTACGTELVCRSQMLTVWRRFHAEVDSMGASDGNFILGSIPVGRKIRGHETTTITVNPSPVAPLEINRFEGGRFVANGKSFDVISNTTDTLTIRNRSIGIVSIPDNFQFQLYDDDDFNDDDGTNLDGDTGEDIQEPDTSLLTANSDDPNTNVFAPAYVRPVYDVVDPRDNSFFQANTVGDFEADLRPLFLDWDSRNSNTDIEFWSVYILGAYQHTLTEDQDPFTEAATFGIVDAITGDTSGGSDGEGSGALIFLELHSSKEIVSFPAPPGLRRENVTVGHEVGHLFSGHHSDGGLMGSPITSGDFSNITINRIRGLAHP